VEGVVLSSDVTAKAPVNQAATLRSTLISKYGRWVWFILAVQGMQEEEAQADYLTPCVCHSGWYCREGGATGSASVGK